MADTALAITVVKTQRPIVGTGLAASTSLAQPIRRVREVFIGQAWKDPA